MPEEINRIVDGHPLLACYSVLRIKAVANLKREGDREKMSIKFGDIMYDAIPLSTLAVDKSPCF